MNIDNPVTESELVAHSTAPRVTEKVLEAHIASIHCFNAGQAAAQSESRQWVGERTSIDLLTICIVVMTNGFTVVGQSACASAENYDKAIGERLAFQDAKGKMWPLLGYALRDHIAYDGQSYWAFDHASAQTDPNL